MQFLHTYRRYSLNATIFILINNREISSKENLFSFYGLGGSLCYCIIQLWILDTLTKKSQIWTHLHKKSQQSRDRYRSCNWSDVGEDWTAACVDFEFTNSGRCHNSKKKCQARASKDCGCQSRGLSCNDKHCDCDEQNCNSTDGTDHVCDREDSGFGQIEWSHAMIRNRHCALYQGPPRLLLHMMWGCLVTAVQVVVAAGKLWSGLDQCVGIKWHKVKLTCEQESICRAQGVKLPMLPFNPRKRFSHMVMRPCQQRSWYIFQTTCSLQDTFETVAENKQVENSIKAARPVTEKLRK